MATQSSAPIVPAQFVPRSEDRMPKSIVITGGSRGLGRAVAEAFLAHGWNVFITAPTAKSVAQTVTALQAGAKGGASAAGLARDVALDAQPVWDAAIAAFGAVDV